MRIFVFGNINSGKTTFIKKLRTLFPSFKIIQIDEYRKKYGESTWESEIYTQDKFVEDVYDFDNIIVECTGMGPLGKKLASKAIYKRDIIIHIESSLDNCIERLNNKKFSLIPYPKVEESLKETIIRCHNEIQNNELEKIWNEKILYIIKCNDDCCPNSLPIFQLFYLSNIIDILINDNAIETIYPYGSFARREMNYLSDIDCYIVSKNNIKYFIEKLKVLDPLFIDVLNNKITLRFKNNILIELVIIESLKDGERYLKGSLIKDKFLPIILISDEDIKYLKETKIHTNEPIDSLDYILSELIFYTLSLKKLIITKNTYKYYFHFNIILHNYIRIKEILKGNIDYNYLPKINFKHYIHLLIKDFNNLEIHFSNYIGYFKELIIEIKGKPYLKGLLRLLE